MSVLTLFKVTSECEKGQNECENVNIGKKFTERMENVTERMENRTEYSMNMCY